MEEYDRHSRSRLAGYQPDILFSSHALIVGAGAVGQSLALNLALAGVGAICIVDYDLFEDHNVTRSPFYPTASEQRRWGLEKALVVAHKIRSLMTAPKPRVRYAVAPIQSLGDLPLLQAQLVFAAVDNQLARAYLAERCHVTSRPLIEGGIFAQRLNVSLFGPAMDDPCYRCFSPEKEGAYSCTRFALGVEAQGVIPSLQNTAAILASLEAEMGIQWLHGDHSHLDKRFYANIHDMTINNITLPFSPLCPGIHWPQALAPLEVLEIGGESTLAELQQLLQEKYGLAQIRLPEEFVVRNLCLSCHRLVNAFVPAWRWLAAPYCQECHGSFPFAASDDLLSSKTKIYTNEDEEELVHLTCSQLGLASGTLCEVWPVDRYEQFGERFLVQLKGRIQDLTKKIH